METTSRLIEAIRKAAKDCRNTESLKDVHPMIDELAGDIIYQVHDFSGQSYEMIAYVILKLPFWISPHKCAEVAKRSGTSQRKARKAWDTISGILIVGIAQYAQDEVDLYGEQMYQNGKEDN